MHRKFFYLLVLLTTFSFVKVNANTDLRCVPDFKLPDQWITTYVGPQTPLYTRTFTFLDIVNEELYDVKNNTTYYVWCLDQNMPVATGYLHNVWLYNLDEDLPDDLVNVPKGTVTVEELFKKDYDGYYINFNKILYIINNRNGYGKPEVQSAIWHYSMGADNFTPPPEPYYSRYLQLVNAAESYGDGYLPPPGGKWLLFAYTKVAEDTPHYPEGTLAQPFIMEIDIPECTLTKSVGYWKTHLDEWPVDELVLGNKTYSKSKLIKLLKKRPKGDASIILAKQLIAAKLNVLSGAQAGDDIIALINQADDLISSSCSKIPCHVSPSCPLGQEMLDLAEQLEEYNTSENDYCKCYYSEEEPDQPSDQGISKCKKYKKKYLHFKKKYKKCIKNMCSSKCLKYKKKYLKYYKKYKHCKEKHYCNENSNCNDNMNDNNNSNSNYNDNSNDNSNTNDNHNYNSNDNYNDNSNDNCNGNNNLNDNDNDNDNTNSNCNSNSNSNSNCNCSDD